MAEVKQLLVKNFDANMPIDALVEKLNSIQREFGEFFERIEVEFSACGEYDALGEIYGYRKAGEEEVESFLGGIGERLFFRRHGYILVRSGARSD